MTAELQYSSDTVLYVTRARRLRARFMKRPAMLYSRLALLARSADSERKIAGDRDPKVHFAELVSAAMDGPILRYSARTQLMEQAGTLGIERFEASLIMARIQNESRAHKFVPSVVVSQDKGLPRWLAPAACVGIIQCLVCAAFWLAVK